MVSNKKNTSYSNNQFNKKLLTPMVLGSILNPINSTIISVALIPIGLAFGASPSQTAWLVSALYLATALGQPVVGKLIDLYGPRRLFLIATSLVGISSVIAIFAPNLWWLVIARVLLGLGTCAGYPSSMYLIRHEAERTGEKSPTSVLTILAIATQVIGVIGPSIGGLLIEVGGWQSTFIINLPLSLACIFFGYTRFPKLSLDTKERKTIVSIDYAGILFFGITLISTLLFLMNLNLHHIYLLLIAIVTGFIFARLELKIKDPFIDVRVLSGNTPLLLTYSRSFLSAVISYCFLYGFTQWLQYGRGLSPTHTGLLLLPMFLTGIIVSRITGKSPAIRLKLIVGSVILCIAVTLMLFVNHSSHLVFLAFIILLLGIPQGLMGLANQNAVYHQAVPKQIGTSAGLLRTFMYMGAMLASAANGLFLKSGATSTGIHHLSIFTIVIGIILIMIIISDRSLSKVGKIKETTITG